MKSIISPFSLCSLYPLIYFASNTSNTNAVSGMLYQKSLKPGNQITFTLSVGSIPWYYNTHWLKNNGVFANAFPSNEQSPPTNYCASISPVVQSGNLVWYNDDGDASTSPATLPNTPTISLTEDGANFTSQTNPFYGGGSSSLSLTTQPSGCLQDPNNGNCFKKITFNPSGGSGTYSRFGFKFNWQSDNDIYWANWTNSSQSYFNLMSGNYTFYIEDSGGNKASSNQAYSCNSCGTTTTPLSLTTQPSGCLQDPNNGNCFKKITFNPSGGSGAYSRFGFKYNWQSENDIYWANWTNSSQSYFNLMSGNYTFYIEDSGGNRASSNQAYSCNSCN